MDTSEFLNELRKLRSALFTIKVSEFFKNQDEDTRKEFVEVRTTVMHMVDTLETSELQAIADDLAKNEAEFKDAIADVRGALADLEKAVKIINTIGKVISVAETIAGAIL